MIFWIELNWIELNWIHLSGRCWALLWFRQPIFFLDLKTERITFYRSVNSLYCKLSKTKKKYVLITWLVNTFGFPAMLWCLDLICFPWMLQLDGSFERNDADQLSGSMIGGNIILITEAMVTDQISRLVNNRAAGTDGLGSSFIKQLIGS